LRYSIRQTLSVGVIIYKVSAIVRYPKQEVKEKFNTDTKKLWAILCFRPRKRPRQIPQKRCYIWSNSTTNQKKDPSKIT